MTQLQERLTSAQSEAVRTRETEDILHRTLLLAQRAADEAVAEATAKSRQMLDEAEMSSRRLVAESEAEARRKGEAERRRLEDEIVELAGRRDTLLADVEALTRFEAEYRERMVRALESDLSALRSRPDDRARDRSPRRATSRSRRRVRGVSRDADRRARRVPPRRSRPHRRRPRSSAEPAPPVDAGRATDVDRAGTGARPNASAVVRLEPPCAANARAPTTQSRSTCARSFEQSHGEPAHVQPREGQRDRRTRAAAAGLRPIDLAGDGVDADILDDDAFFATLRDAVHDEKPLGPRDEGDDVTGENRFFDQDADRGSFRDVFRRRR